MSARETDAADAARPAAPRPGGAAGHVVSARDYDTVVHNPHDDVAIAITVMQPRLEPGQAAPLILHGHGFGGARLTGRDRRTVYEQLSGGTLPSTEAARRAAAAGYFVISFDQRGFGDSGGNVNIMDPAIEGADISAILDWAEQKMPRRGHLAYRDNAPVVGALGLSYGGGFQLIGACVDARFTAIVPTAAWVDLAYSLAPDNVVKTAWGTALVALGLPTSGFDLEPVLYRALLQGLASPLTGRGLSDAVADQLYNHSPASFYAGERAENGQRVDAPERATPRVDALLVQGVGDTLFNLNEAIANARGLQAAGNEVHLIAMRYGHSLPFLQNIERIAYQTDASLPWGDRPLETAALELAYLDWKLKGEPPPDGLPRVGVVLDEHTGLTLDALPEGGTEYDFAGEATTGGLDLLLGVLREHTLSSLWHLLADTVENATDVLERLLADDDLPRDGADTATLARLVNALPADRLDELASGGVFLPLTRIQSDDQAIVGIPTAAVDINGDASDPVAFIGIGVRRRGETVTRLLNNQLRPVRGLGARRLELNGVSERLCPGDALGVLVYGYHPQYLASFSALPGRLTFRGRIGLPLIDVSEPS